MKIKLIIILLFITISSSLANPIVTTIVKEGIKQTPKIIKVITPIVASINELNADEVKENKSMSKKKLNLYKTKF